MSTEWSSYWHDVRNLRWTVIDQEVLERVANALGWGPERTLLEIGAGRGIHSKQLFEMMRISLMLQHGNSKVREIGKCTKNLWILKM